MDINFNITLKWVLVNFSAERNSLGSDRILIFVYPYNRLYPVFKILYGNGFTGTGQ